MEWSGATDRRFGEKFQGIKVPFGAKVSYMPTPVENATSATREKFGPNMLTGIFLGWKLNPGQPFKSNGDYLVADINCFRGVDFHTLTLKIPDLQKWAHRVRRLKKRRLGPTPLPKED